VTTKDHSLATVAPPSPNGAVKRYPTSYSPVAREDVRHCCATELKARRQTKRGRRVATGDIPHGFASIDSRSISCSNVAIAIVSAPRIIADLLILAKNVDLSKCSKVPIVSARRRATAKSASSAGSAEMMSSQLIEVTASREQPSIFANAVLAKRTAPSSARAMAGTGYCSSISRAGVWRGSAIAESVARQERRHSNIHQPNCSYAVSPTYGAVSESARKHRKIRLAAARWFARREHAPLLHHSYQEACKLGDITLSMLFLGWPRGWPSRQATDE
jgi:hypothetical protein